MTTEEKKKFIERCLKLIEDAETDREARSHRNFTRGVVSAWKLDGSIELQYAYEIENRMDKL